MGRGIYRSYYKGHKDKIKGEGKEGGERWDWLGWGLWGVGFIGATIQDTWTKSRGRVEAGEGGEFDWGGVEGRDGEKIWTTVIE